jgi:exosortase C (VPDSG-CTERM-specific)
MRRLKLFCLAMLGLSVCFGLFLFRLFEYSLKSELYSYITLVPIIVAFLILSKRHRLICDHRSAWRLAVFFGVFAIGLLSVPRIISSSAWKPIENNSLCLMALAFVCCSLSLCALILGAANFRLLRFPLAFLVFLAPMPWGLEVGVESFLQHASAEAAYFLLKFVGTPILRNDTQLFLPGVCIEVAPECSGIHSTIVLFLIALLAAHLFLQRTISKITLIFGVLVLGIARNAMRIFILAQLSVQVNRNVLDSPLHHNGGPIFFAASLPPFFLLVWLLIKYDQGEIGLLNK